MSSVGLKVGIQGEAEFKRGIKDINGEMRNLRSELYAADREFGKNDKSVEALTSRNKIYTKQVDQQRSKVTLLTGQHSKQKDELIKLEKALEEANKAHGEGSKEVEKAQKAYDDQEKSVRKLESSLSVATSQMNTFEKQMRDNSKELALQSSEWTKLSKSIGDTGTKIKTTGDTMQLIGGSMTAGITAPLTAMAGASVAAFNVVDEGMDTIVKKTGATGDAAKEFEQIYKNLGASVPDSLNDVGAAIGEVNTRLGFTDDKLKKASETFLKFARINDIDVNSAVTLVTRAMADAGIEADDYEKTLDQLTVAAQTSGVNIDSLAGNLAKYGAPMRALGFDTETTIATFAGWEKAGVNVETSFSGMKRAIGTWSAEGKNAQEEFSKTLDLIKSTPDISEATAIAINTFGQRAGPDLADAIQNGRFEIEEYTDALKTSEGSVKRTYDQVKSSTDDAKAAFNRIKIAGSELGETVADSLVPVFETLADTVQKVGRWYKALSPEMRKTIVTTSALVAGIGPLIFVTGKLVGIVGGALTGISTLAGAIGVVKVGAVAATPAIASLASTMTFLTGPVGLAIAAVAGLTAGLGYLYVKQKNHTARTQEEIDATEKFITSSDRLTQSIENNMDARDGGLVLAEAEITATQDLADRIFDLAEQESLSAVEKDLLNVLVSEFNQLMPEANLLIDETTGLLTNERDVTQDLIDKQKERIRLAVVNDQMVQNVKDEFEATQALNKVEEERNRLLTEREDKKNAINAAGDSQDATLRNLNKLYGEYDDILEDVRVQEEELTNQINELGKEYDDLDLYLRDREAWDKQQAAAKETAQSYKDFTNDSATAFQQHLDNSTRSAQESTGALKSGTILGLAGFPGIFKKTVDEANSSMVGGFENGRFDILKKVEEIKTGSVDIFNPLEDELKAAGLKGAKGLSGGYDTWTPEIKKSARNMRDGTFSEVNPLIGEMTTIGSNSGANLATELDKKKSEAKWAGGQLYIESNKAVMPIIAALSTHGAMAGIGFHDGMRDQKESIATQSDSIVQKVLGVFKSGFGIKSPSTVMYKIGAFTMEGFLNSIKDNAGFVMQFIDKMLSDIMAAFEAGNFNLTAAIDFVGTGAMEFFKSVGIGGSDFGSLVVPVQGAITSGFGYRSAESTSGVGSTNHMGIDIGAGYGVAVGAAGAGTVSDAGYMGGYGNSVEIDHGGGLKTFYAHLSEILVGVGQVVKQLQTIGLVGSTGNSTGPHLHFGVMQDGKWVDPSSIWGYDVGTRYVPKTQVAMVHQGEMIVPKSENPYANSGGQIMPQVRQPVTIQVMLQDGRVLAENIIDDINALLGGKKKLQDRGMA